MTATPPEGEVTYQRYAHALFCESVRQEISGQFTFVGVFPGRVALPVAPGTPGLMKLSAAVWLVTPVANLPRRAQLILRLPDGTQHSGDMLSGGPPREPGTSTQKRSLDEVDGARTHRRCIPGNSPGRLC